jgi:hypothetical protein
LAYNSPQQKLEDMSREEKNDGTSTDPEAQFDMTGI